MSVQGGMMTTRSKQIGRIHLFAQPSFLNGMARVVDPFGTLNNYNISESPEQADFYATYSDWLAVGDDLRYAIEEVAKDLADKM